MIGKRFWSKVEFTDSCWLWTGAIDGGGYGCFWVVPGSKQDKAHRIAYELFKRPIPAGLEVGHLCRVRRCVNPEHLEAVQKVEAL